MKNLVANSELLKEFQQSLTSEEALSGPMSEEDYRFEKACEQIFHINGD